VSVMMTMVMDGDGEKLEQYAAEHADEMRAIRDHAVEHGLIAHRFYASDGQIMVVDEWPDAESCLSFLGHTEAAIGEMMVAAGVTGQPEPKFWRELETHDEYGWNA
jgi:hypothetical protein